MTKFKQKSLSILLVIVLALTAAILIACDTNENGTGNGTSNDKQYTVTFDANGGIFADGSTVSQEVNEGDKLIQPTVPIRRGYIFMGWLKDENGNDLWDFDTDTVTGNITLFAQWLQGRVGLSSVEGATISGKQIKMFVDSDVIGVYLSDKVQCNEGCSWKLYVDQDGELELANKNAPVFDGDNVYYIIVSTINGNETVTYKLTVHRSFEVTVNYYDGDVLLYSDKVFTGKPYSVTYIPTILGFTFNKWVDVKGKNFTAETVWEATNLYADKTANNYAVSLDVDDGDELDETEFELTYGSPFTLPVPTRTGHSFVGWYVGDDKYTDENGDSVNAWNITEETTLRAHWQANKYYVRTIRNDPNAGSIIGGGMREYGSRVSVTVTTEYGYTWVGWFDGETLLTNSFTYEFTMGLGTTLTAKWSKVTLELNKSDAGTVSDLAKIWYRLGQGVTVKATTNAGYTWVGWYKGDELLTDEQSYTFTMGDTNATYTAHWSKLTIDKTIGGGSISGLNDTFKVGDTATLTAVTSLGYEFVGWYDGDRLLSNQVDYTFEFTATDVTYYAKWQVVEEMKPFIFRSTSTRCVITGIYDKTVTEIVVPDYVTMILPKSFNGCSNLESITVPFAGTQASPTGLYPFAFLFDGEPFEGSMDIVGYYGTLNGLVVYSKMCTVPSTLKYVTVTGGSNIHYRVFYGYTSLQRVVLPETVTEIGEGAFDGCTGLTEITIPASVTKINASFQNCTNLTSVIFENPTGWTVSNPSLEDVVTLDSTVISDKELVANYLISMYAEYTWVRSDEQE